MGRNDFMDIMGYDPSIYDYMNTTAQTVDGQSVELNCPVDNVSFGEAAYYANQLSILHGYDTCYDCYDDLNLSDPSGTPPTLVCQMKYDESTYTPIEYACDGYRIPTVLEWSIAQNPFAGQKIFGRKKEGQI